MDYLPEWKVYLWKKLLLNKEKFDKGAITPHNFMFFSDEEQFKLIGDKTQRMINSAENAYNVAYDGAIAGRKTANVDTSGDQPIDDDYYSFHPIKILSALIELMDSKPAVLSIIAKLGKQYILDYRTKGSQHLAQERKKQVASMSMGSPYKINGKFNSDFYSGLGETIYIKADAGLDLSPDEFKKLAGPGNSATHDYLTLQLKINKPALETMLAEYLDDFAASNLVAPRGVHYYDPSLQKKNIHAAILAMTNSYSPKNLIVTIERIAQYGKWQAGDEMHYRIFESLFSLEKMGEIEIGDIRGSEVIISLASKSHPQNKTAKETHEETLDIEKEKTKIRAIKFVADFRIARERWFNVKGIIDGIYKELPPVSIGSYIVMPITLDKAALTVAQQKMLSAVLNSAYHNGALAFVTPKSSVVISSEPVRRFLGGENILVGNPDAFDTYRMKVDDLCDFIQKEEVKFSDIPNSQRQSKPAKELSMANKKKLFILEKLKEEWDLTSNKPVSTRANFGYSYTRPAGEARISQQKFSRWMGEGGVSDWYEIESILGGFQGEGLISGFKRQNEYE